MIDTSLTKSTTSESLYNPLGPHVKTAPFPYPFQNRSSFVSPAERMMRNFPPFTDRTHSPALSENSVTSTAQPSSHLQDTSSVPGAEK